MKRRTASRTGELLLLPAIFYMTATTIFPLAYMVYMSLMKWNLMSPGRTFVGLQNYVNLFAPGSFYYYSAGLTLAFAVSATAIEFLFALGVAMLLNRESKLAVFTTQICIIPLMMTPILIDMVWKYLFNPLLGPLTYLASLVGILNPAWFDAIPNVFFSLLVVDIWQWAPFMILILLAGLISVPPEEVEAAVVDGAGAWSQFRYVILPSIRPVILVAVVFRLIDAFKVFNKIYILTAGAPGSATETLSYNIFYYSLGFGGDVGYGATASVVFLLLVMAICMSLMLVALRTIRQA